MDLTRASTPEHADRLNYIVNHPAVRPYALINDMRDIDLAPVMDKTLILMSANGGFLFDPIPRTGEHLHAFDLHSFFLPEGRGVEAHGAAWAAAEWVFTRTMAVDIFTTVPDDAPHAKPPVTMGFRQHFKRKAVLNRAGVPIDCAFWRLNLWDWAMRARGLTEEGEAFHRDLEAKRAAAGIIERAHAHDEAHDRYVGLAVKMWRHGKLQKAMSIYNVWCDWAGNGAKRIEIIGLNPQTRRLLIDMPGEGRLICNLDGYGFELDLPTEKPAGVTVN